MRSENKLHRESRQFALLLLSRVSPHSALFHFPAPLGTLLHFIFARRRNKMCNEVFIESRHRLAFLLADKVSELFFPSSELKQHFLELRLHFLWAQQRFSSLKCCPLTENSRKSFAGITLYTCFVVLFKYTQYFFFCFSSLKWNCCFLEGRVFVTYLINKSSLIKRRIFLLNN